MRNIPVGKHYCSFDDRNERQGTLHMSDDRCIITDENPTDFVLFGHRLYRADEYGVVIIDEAAVRAELALCGRSN
jgi:hypothetical protein